MFKIFRGAAPLVFAASAFGLAGPAAAQAPVPLPYTIAAPDAVTPDGVPPLPRVVPPKRPAPASPGTTNPTTSPDKKGVDLLTPPAVPSAWSATPIKTAAIPHAPAPPPEHKPAASYPTSMTPALRSTYSPEPPRPLAAAATHGGAPVTLRPMSSGDRDHPLLTAARPTLMPLSVASAAPVARPTPAPKKIWPAAFQTRDETKSYETMGVVYFDKPIRPAKPVAAAKPDAAAKPVAAAVPIVAVSGNLRSRVAASCGADAMTVATIRQPDGGTLVKVRVHDAGAEQKVIGKILQLPEMAEPTVRLLVEVKP